MRLSVASLRRVVKGDLTIQFVPQALTSYGGLELLDRYLRQIDLVARLRQAFTGLRSDYGSARIALVLLTLFYVGARRLEHLRYLGGDLLVTRFCGLARLPTRRTVADWLRQFTQETLAPLVALNRDLVTEALAHPSTAKVVSVRDGEVIASDGPYAEVKEHLAGFYLIECDSIDRAVQVAARIPEADFVEIEVRPVLDHISVDM